MQGSVAVVVANGVLSLVNYDLSLNIYIYIYIYVYIYVISVSTYI